MTTRSNSGSTGQQVSAGRSAVSQPVGSTRTLQTVKGLEGQVTSRVRRTLLPGGLRVITEHMAGVRSASIGVWVGVGSRDETPALHGASHFLEHLLFKGTRERSALDISVALDEVGGEFNAFTAKEYTCFHARVLDDDLSLAVDVLGDMITNSLFTGEDVDAEREVILDEIAMHDDDPDDVVHNLFAQQAWGDSPLGRPIAGSVESILGLTRDQIVRFHRKHYRPANMVVAVAGNLDHASVVRQVRKAFSRQGFLDRDETPVPPRRGVRARRVHPGTSSTTKPFEQVNLVLGVGGLTRRDDRRFALGVLNTALGGGTSSRLFQEVREQRGLAYSIYSFASHHADAGVVGVSVGCLPGKVDDVLAVVRAELAKVAARGITAQELERGQGQLRGGLVLGLEDSGSRMSRLGKAELIHDELLTLDQVLARIEGVTLDEVQRLAAELFTQPEILAVVGPEDRCAVGRLLPATDDADDRRGLLLDDRDAEAGLGQAGRRLLDDPRDQLGPGGLVEEVDGAAGHHPLVEQGHLVVAGAHPEEVDVEGEHLVQALDRHAQRGQVDLADDEAAGVDELGVATLGAVHAGLGAVDGEELAGLQPRADELRRGARSAPDLEHLIVGLDVGHINRPLDPGRNRLQGHAPSLPRGAPPRQARVWTSRRGAGGRPHGR